MRRDLIVCLVIVATGSAFAALAANTPTASVPSSQRRVVNRSLVFSPDTSSAVPELFVSPGVPTTLIFTMNINATATRLADPKQLIYKPTIFQNTAVFSPRTDLPPGAVVPLSIALEDGTLVSFLLRPATTDADFQVNVELKITHQQAPESLDGLKETIARLQGAVDECQASAGSSGISKIASLVLANDPESPTSETFELHKVHSVDKQSRLLVRIHHLYRLFNDSYLLLTVENRDPSRVWVLDRPELTLKGSNDKTSLKVVAFDTDVKSLAPGDTAKIVAAFETPAQQPGQKIALTLFEKGGSRQASLEFEP